MSAAATKNNKMVIFLIPICIAINLVGGQIAIMLKLPVYLDAMGTIIAGALCGMGPGIIVGLISNLINSITLPANVAFALINIAIGILSAILSQRGMLTTLPKAIASSIAFWIICTALSIPITVLMFGGFSGAGDGILTSALLAGGASIEVAASVGIAFSELLDKISNVIIVYFIIASMPKRFLVKLPFGSIYIKESAEA